MTPQVSIVVRSYNRVSALCALLHTLLRQRHDSFEIIVVEQSTSTIAQMQALLAVAADPRIVLLHHPRLGGARARNVGVERTRGEFILFIDDDDVPISEHWITQHLQNYDDPKCLGTSGRHEVGANDDRPYWLARRAYRRCQRYSPLLKMPWTYVRQGRRKAPVDAVHGTNSSIRRSAWERFGGWDEDTPIEDEASFGLRAQRMMQDGEYFAFDPVPTIRRGVEQRGGLNKRFIAAPEYFARLLSFVHHILGRYHRRRVIALYPLYVLAVYGWTLSWLWTESLGHDTLWKRLRACVGLTMTFPVRTAGSLIALANEAPTYSGKGSPSRKSAPAPRTAQTEDA